MTESFVAVEALQDMNLWPKLYKKRAPVSFDLEITARCNNNCRHCYINLPAGDREAKAKELSLAEIAGIADDAVSMGAVWCLITGGEPLLREDFEEIYLALKKRGLLVTVFTDGCLIAPRHVDLFKQYPPRDIEISVYGVTQETYERVSRRRGTFTAFMRGLNLLFDAGVPVRLKAMAIQSNVDELPAISQFCREHTSDYFRFDAMLHLRYDGNESRNAEIRSERLAPKQVIAIETADKDHFSALEKACGSASTAGGEHAACDCMFHCGAGTTHFSVNYQGIFRLCSTLHHPDTVFNLRQGSLAEAWAKVPAVRNIRTTKPQFIEACRTCPVAELCPGCAAYSYLESGEMDYQVEYFCEVAHLRAEALRRVISPAIMELTVK